MTHEPPTDRKRRPGPALLVQILVSATILGWLFYHTDWPALGMRFSQMRIPWFLAAMLAYAANLSLSSVRWGVILQALEVPAPALWLLRLNWVGAYFNQVLPGSVSGDVVRAWYTRPQTSSATLALAAVFGDRFLGMGSLVGIATVAYAVGQKSAGLLPRMGETIALLAFGYLLIVLLILSPKLGFLKTRAGKFGRKLHEIRTGMGALLCHPRAMLQSIILSLLVQVCSILMFWFLAKSLGVPADATVLWIIWPVISLFLAVPFSLAGWGLREGLMVFYLGFLHVSHDQALALSLLLGVTVLLTSLPGALLWLGVHHHPLATAGAVTGTGRDSIEEFHLPR